MISLDVTIYYDALALLTGDKPNLLEEVKSQFLQTDYYDEQIVEDLNNMYEDFGELYDRNMESISMIDYIKLSTESKPSYNYGETRESFYCNHFGTIAFDIPCDFDDEAFLKRLLELEEEKNVEDEKEM